MNNHSLRRTLKTEISEMLSLSIPLMASQLIYACSGFIGTAMVAQLGEEALARQCLSFYGMDEFIGLIFWYFKRG